MPRTLDIKNAFNTGEISPFLLGRTDLAKYVNACETISNFYVRVQGGVSRRPGLRYIQNLPGPGRMIPFSSDSANSFVLIFMNLTLWIYQVTTGITTVIPTPYLFADNLELLKYVRIGNIMYLVHPKYPVQKLSKLGDENWVLVQPTFYAAPATQQDEDVSQGTINLDGFGLFAGAVTGTGMVVDTATQVALGQTIYLFTSSLIGATLTAGTGTATVTGVGGNTKRFYTSTFDYINTYDTLIVNITVAFDATQYTVWNIVPDTSMPHSNPQDTLITITNPANTIKNTALFSNPVLIRGDIGKKLIAGTGIAIILDVVGSTSTDPFTGATLYDTAVIQFLNTFDLTSYPAGNWFLRGSPGAYFSAGDINPDPGPTTLWQGSNQFGDGSQVVVRATTKAPTDGTFQESTGTSYVHVHYPPTGATFPPYIDTFRVTDVGRYVSFSGGYGIVLRVGTGTNSPPTGGGTNASEVLIQILSPPTVSVTDAFGGLLIAPAFPGSWFFDDQAFTGPNGFPDAVCFFQDRLWFAGTDNNPQTIWASQIDDFENFAKGTLDDDGIEVTIASGDVDKVLWLQPYLGNVVAGTFRGEHIVSGTSSATLGANSQPITPSNISATFQSAYGVTGIQPIIVQEILLYIQRSQFNVYQMEFNIQSAAFGSKDLNVLNDLITATPFLEMSYQQNPGKIIWFIAADPTNSTLGQRLFGMTYDKEQDVFAWHRHSSNGAFISVATIPHVINGAIQDETYFMMKRLGTYRLEVMDNSMQLDFSSHFISNTPVDHIVTGIGFNIDYLNGQSVIVVADGAVLPVKVLSGGRYDFPPGFTAQDIQIGFNYSAKLITARPEVRISGTAQGLLKRWNRIWVRVYNSLGLVINGQFIPNRIPENFMDEGVPLFTGDEDVTNLGYDRDGRVVIEQFQPLPCNVLAMFGSLIVGEN